MATLQYDHETMTAVAGELEGLSRQARTQMYDLMEDGEHLTRSCTKGGEPPSFVAAHCSLYGIADQVLFEMYKATQEIATGVVSVVEKNIALDHASANMIRNSGTPIMN